MPYMRPEQRAAGPWVAAGLNNTDHGVPARHGVCGFFEGGDHCGALSEHRYVKGWRCTHHAPVQPAPDPSMTAEGVARRADWPQPPDQSRYGRST